MNSLSTTVLSIISQSIEEFSSLVSEKFNIDKDEILELWNNNVSLDVKVSRRAVSSTSSVEKKSAPPKKESTTTSSSTTTICKYEFKKGKNIGTRCNSRISEGDYCKKHKGPAEKEEKPQTKSSEKSEEKEEEPEEKSVIKKAKENTTGLTLRRNTFGNYEHSETRLLFDRKTRDVYGKQNYETESVDQLSEEDIEICQQMNFKYRLPLTLNKKKEEETEEEEVEEVEEVEEEEDEEEEVEDD